MIWTIANAMNYSYEAHRNQFRNDLVQTPYIIHPIRVYDILRRVISDKNILAAAILHDVVEDTPITSKQIAARFGPIVAGYVHELSNPPEITDKYEKHREKIKRFSKMSIGASMVKIADMISNCEDCMSTIAHCEWNDSKKIDFLTRCASYGMYIFQNQFVNMPKELSELWWDQRILAENFIDECLHQNLKRKQE